MSLTLDLNSKKKHFSQIDHVLWFCMHDSMDYPTPTKDFSLKNSFSIFFMNSILLIIMDKKKQQKILKNKKHAKKNIKN